MEYYNDNALTTTLTAPSSLERPHQSITTCDSLPRAVKSPCSACKVLRRRCMEKCGFAPYFPPNNPLRFAIVHKVFGGANIMKMLQEIPEHQRADAADSFVYEAHARIRDPIYGCTGAIFALQQQISELQEQLAKAQAQILLLNSQMPTEQQLCINPHQQPCETTSFSQYDQNIYSILPHLMDML